MKTIRDRERESAVEAFLLQKHRMLLVRLIAVQVSFRLIFLICLGALILTNAPSKFQLYASYFVGTFTSMLWYIEQQSLYMQLRELEETLAEKSGGEWEDTYIKSRYSKSSLTTLSKILHFEPMLWFLAIGILVPLRIFPQ